MLKLKGQTESGEWVVFSVSDIEDANRDYTEIRLLNGDNINYILTATIQLADDPRKAMLAEIREIVNNLSEVEQFYKAACGTAEILKIIDEMEAKL